MKLNCVLRFEPHHSSLNASTLDSKFNISILPTEFTSEFLASSEGLLNDFHFTSAFPSLHSFQYQSYFILEGNAPSVSFHPFTWTSDIDICCFISSVIKFLMFPLVSLRDWKLQFIFSSGAVPKLFSFYSHSSRLRGTGKLHETSAREKLMSGAPKANMKTPNSLRQSHTAVHIRKTI